MTLELEPFTPTAPGSATPLLDEFRLSDLKTVRAAVPLQFTQVQTEKSGATKTKAPNPVGKPLPDLFLQGTGKDRVQTACPSVDSYKSFIDAVSLYIYDPTRLGNIPSLKNKFNCDTIKDTKEAVARADESIRVANDPFTDVLTSSEWAELRNEMAGSYGGIGIESTPIGDDYAKPSQGLFVRQVAKGSPAEKAGIRPGDVIITIDGVDIRSLTPKQGEQLLRGTSDAEAKVVLERNGKRLDVSVPRESQDSPAVSEKAIEGGYAYIKLRDFIQKDAPKEMENALKKHGSAKGFIIDLRDNPGGLMDNAFLIASLFMKEGEVVSMRSRKPSDPANPEYTNTSMYLTRMGFGMLYSKSTDDWLPRVSLVSRMHDYVDKPVVILTNQGTASAAEILAGALKDQGEATVIGTNTYGKGIGQVLIDNMPGGSAVKVTSLRYHTPSGEWIGDGHHTRRGVAPHIRVTNPTKAEYGSASDEQYKKAIEFLNSKTRGR